MSHKRSFHAQSLKNQIDLGLIERGAPVVGLSRKNQPTDNFPIDRHPPTIRTGEVTPAEEKQILAAAEADGKAPSEWARDLLLRGAISTNRGEMELHIFTELVGIQMLLMSTLEPLFYFAESRPPRPRRRRSFSPSATRTGRNDHASCSRMGSKRVDHLAAARLSLYARSALPGVYSALIRSDPDESHYDPMSHLLITSRTLERFPHKSRSGKAG